MIVTEIFTSIQGESTWQGYPFSFVRLTACNLRCVYCDTPYAYTGGTARKIEEIVSEVEKRQVPRVLITGGEPLLQEETPELIDRFIDAGFKVLLETNGSLPLTSLNSSCVKIVDVKTPGSGEGGSFFEDNLSCLSRHDEIKFVLTGRDDFDFAREFTEEKLQDFPGAVLLSPAKGFLDAEPLAQWLLGTKANLRLNMQLHKYIFGMEKRGV